MKIEPLHEKNVQLLEKINNLLQDRNRQTVIIAIDGRCASGKTTLADELQKLYDCNVFHMDDFFLRPQQRTSERLSIPGENVDHERFLAEVLVPVKSGDNVTLRRYNCHLEMLEEPVVFGPNRLNIIEGSYSFHPELIGQYDLKVFLDITEELQKERIIARNGKYAETFFKKWIPLEEKYFEAYSIMENADLIIR